MHERDFINDAIINGYIESLVLKAMDEIPNIPKDSWEIDNYRFSEKVFILGCYYAFSLNCSPPKREETHKAMMVRCEVYQPSKCLALTVPLMEKPVSEVLLSLKDDIVKLEIKKSFEYLIEDMLS